MKHKVLTGALGQKFRFQCGDIIDGVPVNPVLPRCFDNTPNDARTDRSMAWWDVPFVRTETRGDSPRYDVRCLDGGAWDRSTWWGTFGTLEGAVAFAKEAQSPHTRGGRAA